MRGRLTEVKGIVGIGHDPGTASHIGTFGVGVAGLIILEVEGRVDEGKIRKEAFGADPAGQLEQVVVGLARVVVDPVLDLENMDGEDGRFAVAEAGLGGEQDVADDHASFRRDVQTVIDGAERDLRAGTGVHGV